MLANPRLLSAELVKRLSLPTLAKAFGEAGGPVIFHHGASPILAALELYRGLPGIAGFLVDQRDDFGKARGLLGPGPLLLSGLSGPLLEGLRPELAGRLARRALAAMAGDPRSVFASTAADIPWDTEPGVLDAVAAEIAAEAEVPA